VNPRELLILLARFTITGYGGLVELRCRNCPAVKTFGDGMSEIAFPELFVWARDHKCPAQASPFLRPARRDLVVA
jgi:hypothetical protein